MQINNKYLGWNYCVPSAATASVMEWRDGSRWEVGRVATPGPGNLVGVGVGFQKDKK